MNALIFAGIFLLMLAFVAGAEAVCDWYWQRRRRKAPHPTRSAGHLPPRGKALRREALRDAK